MRISIDSTHEPPQRHSTGTQYKLPKIRLRGIGGRINLLDKVGIIKTKQPDNKHCKLMCYVFDEEIGQTKEMLLISLSAIIASKINILYHMRDSNKNQCHDLKFWRFWPNNKSFEEVCEDVTVDNEINHVFKATSKINSRDLHLSSDNYEEVQKD